MLTVVVSQRLVVFHHADLMSYFVFRKTLISLLEKKHESTDGQDHPIFHLHLKAACWSGRARNQNLTRKCKIIKVRQDKRARDCNKFLLHRKPFFKAKQMSSARQKEKSVFNPFSTLICSFE